MLNSKSQSSQKCSIIYESLWSFYAHAPANIIFYSTANKGDGINRSGSTNATNNFVRRVPERNTIGPTHPSGGRGPSSNSRDPTRRDDNGGRVPSNSIYESQPIIIQQKGKQPLGDAAARLDVGDLPVVRSCFYRGVIRLRTF